MKATELRIGNIINDTSGEDLPITELIKKGTFWNVKVKGYSMQVDLDDCSPVELTEEWLLRFGFIQDKERTQFYSIMALEYYEILVEIDPADKEIYISLCVEDNEITINANSGHVHQLQNLYHALTGKELELK